MSVQLEIQMEKLQAEIEALKRHLQYLEHLVPNYGQAVAWHSGSKNVPHDAYVPNLNSMDTNLDLITQIKKLTQDLKEGK